MIINEIQTLKKIEDPTIIKMIKMLKSSNNIYLVYEYLSGPSLASHLNSKKLNENDALKLLGELIKPFKVL